MPSTKKRKLTVKPTPPPLSAIAARQALQTRSQVAAKKDGSPNITGNSFPSGSDTPIIQVFRAQSGSSKAASEMTTPGLTETDPIVTGSLTFSETGLLSSFESCVGSPELPATKPPMTLTTLKPSKEAIKEHKDGSLSLKLAPGERVVILGQYRITVQQGQITLMGATLRASKASYQIHAPSSHSLPVIRSFASDIDDTEIQINQCESGLKALQSLSPIFGRLWNDDSGSLGSEYGSILKRKTTSSFQLLFSSKDSPKKTYLQPLISPPEWNEVLSNITGNTTEKTPTIMICGPKSSGKSTFTKLLVNTLLSAKKRAGVEVGTGVALLDLDPGQPEYSPPGQLSLIYVQEPNFGPPFSHPVQGTKSRAVRSHAIGAISPSLDPSLYMACALDLFSHYRRFRSITPHCPLIINTPGWVLGTGLEILVDLISKIRPTEVLYMSHDGPEEVVDSLREAGKSTILSTLPSQGTEYATRTAAHLRTMQYMAYFHLDPLSESGLAWQDSPLTSIPPWEVRYSGEDAGILGVLCYGEQPPASLLADTINGSLVAIIVIDDAAAIPGLEQHLDSEDSIEIVVKNSVEDAEIRVFDEARLQPHYLEQPLILQTPEENIPYFNPANAISLDPKHSHTVGVALIRGIDIARQRIQVLSPVAPSIIEAINDSEKSIVFLSGKLDTPGWAYTEALVQKAGFEKAARNNEEDSVDTEDEDGNVVVDTDKEKEQSESNLDDGFHNAPWIERLEGSQGRGIGSRVWRVRRDLGKNGDGGD